MHNLNTTTNTTSANQVIAQQTKDDVMTLNIQDHTTEHNGEHVERVSPYQQLVMAKQAFKAYLAAPESQPYRNQYGTKLAGRVTLIDFMIWAIVRGKNPEKCSHDPAGKTYQNTYDALSRLATSSHPLDSDHVKRVLLSLFSGTISINDFRKAWRAHQSGSTPR